MLAMHALLHEMNGSRAEALASLEEALSLAAPGGLERIFVDLGAGLVPLLSELADRDSAPEFARKILQLCPPLPAPGKPRTPAPARLPDSATDAGKADHDGFLGEPMTRREQEVLALLAQRFTADGNCPAACDLRQTPSSATARTSTRSLASTACATPWQSRRRPDCWNSSWAAGVP